MEILVFSDSHKHNENMQIILERFGKSIKYVLHLGDCSIDAESMALRFPELEFYWVGGNCDVSPANTDRVVLLGGKKIFITHGHNYGVKYNYQRLVYASLEREADACFFGHTHQPIVFYECGILFFNPGSISFPRGRAFPSYGIAQVSQNSIGATIHDHSFLA